MTSWKIHGLKNSAPRRPIEKWSVEIISTQLPGDTQKREVVCIPLFKLAGFLANIKENKVRAEIKEKVIAYQHECDDALWQYWITGRAVNPVAIFGKTVFTKTVGSIFAPSDSGT